MCRKKGKSYTTTQRKVLGEETVLHKGYYGSCWQRHLIYSLAYSCSKHLLLQLLLCSKIQMVLLFKDEAASAVMPLRFGADGLRSGQRAKTHIKANRILSGRRLWWKDSWVLFQRMSGRGVILGWMVWKDLFAGLHFKCNLESEPSQQNTVRGPLWGVCEPGMFTSHVPGVTLGIGLGESGIRWRTKDPPTTHCLGNGHQSEYNTHVF